MAPAGLRTIKTFDASCTDEGHVSGLDDRTSKRDGFSSVIGDSSGKEGGVADELPPWQRAAAPGLEQSGQLVHEVGLTTAEEYAPHRLTLEVDFVTDLSRTAAPLGIAAWGYNPYSGGSSFLSGSAGRSTSTSM